MTKSDCFLRSLKLLIRCHIQNDAFVFYHNNDNFSERTRTGYYANDYLDVSDEIVLLLVPKFHTTEFLHAAEITFRLHIETYSSP